MDHDWRDFLLREIERQGLDAKAVSKAAGQGPTYIRDITKGRKGKLPSEPGVDKFEAIARVLGMSYAKLRYGRDHAVPTVAIIGAAAGDEKWVPRSNRSAKSQEFEFHIEGGEPVALEVQGNALRLAGYRNGDLLIGAKRVGANADNLLGLECIVLTEQGDRYVKILGRGNVRGTFNLRSVSDTKAADIPNVRIAWAAPILWIKRAQH